MNRKLLFSASAVVAARAGTPASAQRNYTDGGDLYGGAHAAGGKQTASKHLKKQDANRSGKFDPYSEGEKTDTHLAPAQKSPDERPQPDDVARSGKFDPYTEGRSK
ncbi:hypothetical protein [Cupriavidus sp. RAF12]|uniref:hypothetical protein n=1 Tax=Cupriavidus sp. RAF12 TaxID=3233050 RepID=UPI003F8E91D4